MRQKECLECGTHYAKKSREWWGYWVARQFCSTQCSNAWKNRRMEHPPLDPMIRVVKLDGEDGCWRWNGAHTGNGYAECSNHKGRYGTIHAHRRVYEHLVGPIPNGLDIDHLCRNRWCVNPAHMEPVTRKENLRRSPLWRAHSYKPGWHGMVQS